VGMLIGTFFTLVLLPAIYAVLASDHSEDELALTNDLEVTPVTV